MLKVAFRFEKVKGFIREVGFNKKKRIVRLYKFVTSWLVKKSLLF